MTTEQSTDVSPLLEFEEQLSVMLECNREGRATNFFAWKEDVEMLLEKSTLSNTGQEKAIMMSLADKPQEQLETYLLSFREANPDTELSAKDIIDIIQKMFFNDVMRAEAIQELFDSSVDLDGLDTYNWAYSRGRHLVDSMTKEEILVHIYARGLPDSIRHQVLLDAPDDVADATRAAVRKRAEWRCLNPKPVSSRQRKKTNRVSKSHSHKVKVKVTCDFCGRVGHHEKVCRYRLKANRDGPPPSFFKKVKDQKPKGQKSKNTSPNALSTKLYTSREKRPFLSTKPQN